MAVGKTRGAHLGGAYVTVDAEVGDFDAKLAAKLKSSLVRAEKSAKRSGQDIGKSIADGIIEGFNKKLPEIRSRIKASLSAIKPKIDVKADVKTVGDKSFKISARVDEASLSASRERISNTGRQIQRDATAIGGGIFGRVVSVLSGLSERFAGMAAKAKTVMGSARGNAIALAASLYGIYAAALAAASAFNAIGREALNVLKLGLMAPGILASIAAVAAPMLIIFNGLDKKLGDLFNKDPKKAKAALAGMHGSLRAFAIELRAAKPWYDSLVASTRESFFKNIIGVIPRAISMFGSSIKSGFSSVAASVGSLFKGIFDSLATPETVKALNAIFSSVSRIILSLKEPGSDFFVAMRDAAVAALPAIESIAGMFGGLLTRFANWLEEKIKSGEFELWIRQAITTLRELGALAYAVGQLLGTLFDESNQDGESFIVKITKMTNKLEEFAASPAGRLALEGIGKAAKAATIFMVGLTGTVFILVGALASLAGAISRAIDKLQQLFALSGKIQKINVPVPAAKSIAGKVAKFADGGIIDRPTLATFAEDGPEVAIPLTKPARARQLATQSGLAGMLGVDGSSQVVNVYIGNEKLDSRVVRVTTGVINSTVRSAINSGLAPA